MGDQTAVVAELFRRRNELDSDNRAIVEELAQRFGKPTSSVPSVPVPLELREPTTAPAGFGMTSRDPRTGRQYTEQDVTARVPIVDAPTEGIKGMARGAAMLTAPGAEAKAKGAAEVLEGAMGVATLLLPAVAAAAPARVAAALGAGTGAQQLAQGGMLMLGAPPGTAQLTGDIAGLIAGGRIGTSARIGALSTIPEHLIPSVIPKDPVLAMTKAVKPLSRNLEFPRILERALPEVKASEAQMGRPITGVDDMIEAVKIAKQRVWAQREQFAGPARQMGMQVDLTPVADAMVKSIPAKVKLEDPRAAARIMDVADKYRGKFGIQEAEQFLKESNAELDAYYAKYPTAQRQALTANPETAQLEAQARQLRQAIYGALDAPGQGAAPKELSRRYGSLLNFEEELYRRRNVALRQAPASLSEQIGKWHALGLTAKGLFRLFTGDVYGGADIASAVAMRKAAVWLRDQNTTNAIIQRTMENYNRMPVPVAPPTPIEPAGLLGPGPLVTPPPADTSFVRSVPAPRKVARDPKTGQMKWIYTGEAVQ